VVNGLANVEVEFEMGPVFA
jgi:hypothetical protein